MREHHDTVVIGGGQAGLAMSAVLQQRGREHVVLERRQVGERWRTERWESLRFQFPNWSLELPGYAYAGEDPDGFAHWREVLRLGCEQMMVDSHCPCRTRRSTPAASSSRPGRSSGRASRSWLKPLDRPCFRPTRRATGGRRTCRRAPYSSWGAERRGARSAKSCCVPGDEADAAFIGFVAAANDLAAALDLDLSEEQPNGSTALPAVVAEVESLDLRREKIAAIIWATGYDYDYGWLRVPVLDRNGRPLQHRGVTDVPGLYFLGLHWMHTFKSGLLAGVGSDAEYLADRMDTTAGP